MASSVLRDACPAADQAAEAIEAMETREILRRFSETEGLPKRAILAAREQRAELTPVFIREIDDYVESDAQEPIEGRTLLLIFHLLGEWRETSAYRPLARFLQCDPDKVEAAIGDAITTTSQRVMAAVCDGDSRPLYDIISNPEADEYIRTSMCQALAMLVSSGDLDRAETARFLRDCFMNLQPQAACYVWEGWQDAIAMLGLKEFRSIVEKAHDRGFISTAWCDFDDFEEGLKRGVESPGAPRYADDTQYTLFGDTIEELSTWYCFSQRYLDDKRRRAEAGRNGAAMLGQPATNPHRAVGRNDPCPCGSGKKFKKCCLH